MVLCVEQLLRITDGYFELLCLRKCGSKLKTLGMSVLLKELCI